jgi:hypothetical protein
MLRNIRNSHNRRNRRSRLRGSEQPPHSLGRSPRNIHKRYMHSTPGKKSSSLGIRHTLGTPHSNRGKMSSSRDMMNSSHGTTNSRCSNSRDSCRRARDSNRPSRGRMSNRNGPASSLPKSNDSTKRSFRSDCRSLAPRSWPSSQPIGQRYTCESSPHGVVHDVDDRPD